MNPSFKIVDGKIMKTIPETTVEVSAQEIAQILKMFDNRLAMIQENLATVTANRAAFVEATQSKDIQDAVAAVQPVQVVR